MVVKTGRPLALHWNFSSSSIEIGLSPVGTLKFILLQSEEQMQEEEAWLCKEVEIGKGFFFFSSTLKT
jgi:hypothetical protein